VHVPVWLIVKLYYLFFISRGVPVNLSLLLSFYCKASDSVLLGLVNNIIH